MAINVSVRHNGVFDPILLPSGIPFQCHEEVCIYLQPMIPPKRFDISLLLGDAQKA